MILKFFNLIKFLLFNIIRGVLIAYFLFTEPKLLLLIILIYLIFNDHCKKKGDL